MNGLGGLNKSPNGVVIGLVQLQLPVVATQGRSRRADRAHRRDGRQGAPQLRDAWTWSSSPNMRCTACRWTPIPRSCAGIDGPEVAAFKQACIEQQDLGLLLDHGVQPGRQPLQYRHHHRRQGRAAALLPQAASLGAGRAVGAGRPRHPGDRRAEGLQARADHLPRRHVPGDGARVRLQGRRDHAAHRRLHRADPPRLAVHQPGQRLLQPDGHRQCLHVRLATAPSTPWAKA